MEVSVKIKARPTGFAELQIKDYTDNSFYEFKTPFLL